MMDFLLFFFPLSVAGNVALILTVIGDIWEDLVRGGYANRIYGGTDVRYSVTRKGMQAVSDETGLLIRYELEFEPKKK